MSEDAWEVVKLTTFSETSGAVAQLVKQDDGGGYSYKWVVHTDISKVGVVEVEDE